MTLQYPAARFSIEEVRNYIAKEKNRRQSNKVLHGHPSPLYWKALDVSVGSLLEQRKSYSQDTDFAVNLYVGTPFCIKTKPAHCGFCLFPSEDYKGNAGVEIYMEYLKKEFELYKPFYSRDKLSSIYFGGGTPNLYKAEHYHRLMGFVDDLYEGVPSDIEITLEGIPQLFTEEKLKAIKAAGFNRVSVGVQQLNDELIRYSGRNQKRSQVFRTLELCEKYDLASSADMIYGWPEQTIDNMLEDLQALVDTGICHLTHYELNIAGRSDFASRKNRSLLPSIQTNIEMYKIAGEFLRSHGFSQSTVYDWERNPPEGANPALARYDYERNMHDFIDKRSENRLGIQQVCGIGFAAVNFHLNSPMPNDQSWIYMNHNHLTDYYEKIDAGELPVARGFLYNDQDVRLAWIFQAMQTMKINHVNYGKIFNQNLLIEYMAVWTDLDERGWISITETEIIFQNEGQYYIPMLQSLIARKRLDEIRLKGKTSLESIAVLTE